MLSVQDSAAAEEVEQVTQPDTITSETTTNLLSSGNETRILNTLSLYATRLYFCLKMFFSILFHFLSGQSLTLVPFTVIQYTVSFLLI